MERPLPKLLDDGALFCGQDTLFALNFLRVSHEVVEHARLRY
jgi:hypothetical protein